MTTVFDPDTVVVYDAATGQPTPMLAALGDWWTCPNWCDGQCHSGNTHADGGVTIILDRVHTRYRWAADCIDATDLRRRIPVELVDEQPEDPDGGYGPKVTVLYIGDRGVIIPAEDADRLTAALTAK